MSVFGEPLTSKHRRPPALRCSVGVVEVRAATRDDLEAIAVIARRAIPGAYHHLLSPQTIATWLESAYSEEAVQRSWEDHPMLVAADDDGPIAFAGVHSEQGQITIGDLFTTPEQRRRGAATALIDTIQGSAGGQPVTADVMLGNHLAERFYEHRGFVPGETISGDLFGEQIVERRWYREDMATETTITV